MNNYSLSLCNFGLSQFYPQNLNCYILIPFWIKKIVIVLFKLTNFAFCGQTFNYINFFFTGDIKFTLT